MGKTQGIEKILGFIGENKDLLNSITSLATGASASSEIPQIQQPNYTPSVPSYLSPEAVTASINEVGSSANVVDSMGSLSFFLKMKNVFIALIVLWTISVIVARFMLDDPEKKKDFEFVNQTLFGNIGVIPTIASIWLMSILLISIVPTVLSAIPKISNLTGNVGNVLGEFIKNLPKLLA
jgi:hypothetical protein